MSDFATAAYHLLVGCWWLALIALGAWVAAIGLGRAAAKPMPPMDDAAADDEWADLCDALDIDRQQVRAAYIETAVAGLRDDIDEWERAW